jgi:hypothetical protein
MKLNHNNIIAFLGFVLLGLVLLGGIVVGSFFVFPDLKVWGVTGVNERNTQVVYRDAKVIQEIFTSRRLIIESQTADIKLLMGKEHKMAEGTIVVEEDASGLSFNSIDRTHIEWLQELVTENNTQVLYYKIIVAEPAGIISKRAPTTVFINLWRDSVAPNGTSVAPYDIILRTNSSVVQIGGDDVDPAGDIDLNSFHINTLRIESAGSVTFPVINNPINNDFYVDANNIVVTGSGITLNCSGRVNNEVKISGSGGTYNFTAIRPKANYNSNALTVSGANNNVKVTENAGGNVSFTADSGYLKLFKDCGSLAVKTTNANISVNSVKGSEGINMETVNGSLTAASVDAGGVIFHANGSAGVDIGYAYGAISIPAIGTGSVRVGKAGSSVNIPKMGIGSVTLGSSDGGIYGNVNVVSDLVNAGNVEVRFAKDANAPTANISGFDGNVSLYNISGAVNVSLRSSGRGNIHAHFLNVSGVSSLTTVGYVNDKNTVSTTANITVVIEKNINPFTLNITGSSYAWDKRGNGSYIFNDNEQNGQFPVGGGSSVNRINAETPSRFTLTY